MNARAQGRLPFLLLLGAVAIAATALALHRPGRSAEVPVSSPLLRGARIDPATLRLVERACENCHSERTRWPWYSRIPPVSWMIRRDVARARASLDLSHWDDYATDQQRALLSAIGAAARTSAMPPGRYLLLHSEGRLSGAEREQLYRWTRAERVRLATPPRRTPGAQSPSVAPALPVTNVAALDSRIPFAN